MTILPCSQRELGRKSMGLSDVTCMQLNGSHLDGLLDCGCSSNAYSAFARRCHDNSLTTCHGLSIMNRPGRFCSSNWTFHQSLSSDCETFRMNWEDEERPASDAECRIVLNLLCQNDRETRRRAIRCLVALRAPAATVRTKRKVEEQEPLKWPVCKNCGEYFVHGHSDKCDSHPGTRPFNYSQE